MLDHDTISRRRADATLAECGPGLMARTKIATAMGWRAVEAVAPGDMVLTFDGGMQPVVDVQRQVVWSGESAVQLTHWPLCVPAGAIGNRSALSLLPGQSVLVESDTAEAIFGDPFAMIPARALDGFRDITPTRPAERIEIVTLSFAQDEVIFASHGALCLCHAAIDLCAAPAAAGYACLSLEEADMLVACLEEEDRERRARVHGWEYLPAVA